MSKMTVTTLRNKIHVKHGFPFKGEFFSCDGEYIVLTPGNFYESGGFKFDENKAKFYSGEIPTDYICRKGDLIVAMTEQAEGLLGCSAIVPEDNRFLHNQRIGLVSVNEHEIDKLFLYYLFNTKSVRQQLRLSSSGSKVKHTSPDRIYDVIVSLPSLQAQQKIVVLLSVLDAKIELNTRINAELEAMAKTLYDYWFVQFDFPNADGKPYKASGGRMVWNAALKREIPAGWEVGELGNYSQIFRGVTYKKEEVKSPSDENTIPILRATNINNGVIDVNDMVYVPKELVSENQMLEKFDVLITMSSGSKAHVGKNAFYYYDNKVSFGAFCSKVSVNKNLRFYVNIHMQSDGFKKYIFNVGLGTNINNLTNKHITEYKLLIPPKQLLLQYENAVEGFYNKIGNNMKENQTLAALRDWLLPLLMNGQASVE